MTVFPDVFTEMSVLLFAAAANGCPLLFKKLCAGELEPVLETLKNITHETDA